MERNSYLSGPDAQIIRSEERIERKYRTSIIQEKFIQYFSQTAVINQSKKWSEETVYIAKEFLIDVAPLVSPKIDEHYWSHLDLASIYAKEIAHKVNNSHILGQNEGQVVMLLHDIGRMVIAHRYLQNDFIAESIFSWCNVREDFTAKIPTIRRILGFRKRFGKQINTIDDMTYAERIVDFSDQLGKMVGGKLFTLEATKNYIQKRISEYEFYWPSEALGRKAIIVDRPNVAIDLIFQESQWLSEKYSIDIDALRENVWVEFQKQENQEWLTKVRNAQKSGLSTSNTI